VNLLEFIEDVGMGREAIKCRKTTRSSKSGGTYLGKTDTNALKRGDQTGLETPVVHAFNDAYSILGDILLVFLVNAINMPLGEYGRKTEI
jgi:hypothetical protein